MKRLFPHFAVLLFALVLLTPPALAGTTERVSVSSAGIQGAVDSFFVSISADGRYVAFASNAVTLAPGATHPGTDIFVRDRLTRTTERLSVSPSGEQANDTSFYLSISADGRYVAFDSNASNLVPGDTNDCADIFVRDRVTRTTERVSLSSTGEQGNSGSWGPSISADGRYIAFGSNASNLVPGDTNGSRDIFIRDRMTGTTERVSLSSTGEQGDSDSGSDYHSPSLSADGRYIAFESNASNLVPGDTNGSCDIFVRDRVAETTERVSLSSAGEQANRESNGTSLSADGRYVAFSSYASNLVPGDTNNDLDVFVRDRVTGTTERMSLSSTGVQANRGSCSPSIGADGRYVAFVSEAFFLVPDDYNATWDVFIRDRANGTTERISVSPTGEGVGGDSGHWGLSLSADGRYVAFDSYASNLVPGDTNGRRDVFVRDRYDTLATTSTFIQPGWNLVSVPTDPVNADPLSVFSGIDIANASFQFWKNGADAGGYQLFGDTFGWTGPVARGTAYWFLYEGAPKPLEYVGLAPSTDFELTIPSHAGAPFWIMFGTPFPAAVNADNIQFKNDVKRPGEGYISWVSAYSDADSSKRIVDANALGWDATARRFVIVRPSGYGSEKAQFDPWWGYWMLVYDTNELKIKFPKP